ncbi:MAG: L-2-amino-thiazoline-4-carboxylic acid hydrolase [Bacteroidales bacterium]|nr:L-2-amino-thiazoline-4-carboxylic acid hydrolase [Bacteroidales bacterium]
MRLTLIDHMIWRMIAPTCLKELAAKRPEWDIRAVRREAKRWFKRIVRETPSIGSIRQNPMRLQLNGASVWFAMYEAAHVLYADSMDLPLYEAMCIASFSSPAMLGRFTKTDMFSQQAMARRDAMAAKVNAIDAEYNWQQQNIRGQTPDEYTLIYTKCGICKLAGRLGREYLLPPMCRADYILMEAAGVCLHRDRTIAHGDDCCYYYCTRKGSEAEHRWQEAHPEGTFVEL